MQDPEDVDEVPEDEVPEEDSAELTASDLEAVAGGTHVHIPNSPNPYIP